MSFNDKKNMFQYEGISDYEKRRRQREQQGNDDNANMAKMYTDTAKEMESGGWYGSNNNKDFASSIGPMYGQDGYNGTAHANWKNYGTVGASGNVYGDDFKFDISQSPEIENNYNISESNYLTQKQQNQQTIDMYNKVIAEANVADQNAYINKIMAEKNAKSQSTALGRGGLGTNSSGQARLNTNYENSLNNISKGANDNVDNIYNQYMNAALALESGSEGLEQQSKIAYHDFLIEQALGMYGDGSVEGDNKVNPHIKDVFTGDDGNEFLSKVDADGDGQLDKLITKQYIDAASELELNKSIDDYFNDDINNYFIQDSTIRGDLKEGIAAYGSKNEEYLKAAKEYEAHKVEVEKNDIANNPDRATDRGADGTATVSRNSPNAAQGTIGSGITESVFKSFASNWDTTYKGDNYVLEEDWSGMGLKSYNKKLNRDQPELIKNKIEGDVIFVDGEGNFVLYDGKWRKMVAK